MNIARTVLLTLLSLNLSSEFLQAAVKKNLINLESKRVDSEKQVKGKELNESKSDPCQWWDDRCS
jgi:hypothetical protein